MFTLVNYLRGIPLFISTDGLLRDCGGVYGRTEGEEKNNDKAFSLINGLFKKNPAFKYVIYLDAPISHSKNMGINLNQFLQELSIDGEAKVCKSPDYFLKNVKDGVVCSSDSIIIDKTTCKIFDLSRRILEEVYLAKWINLERLTQKVTY